jgi:DNA-binding protein HU-beta
MIKADIINRVSEKTGINKIKAEVAVNALFDNMKQALLRAERIELRGFGVFAVRPRKTGTGRNPRTGDIIPIAPGLTVRFKPGLELRPTNRRAASD